MGEQQDARPLRIYNSIDAYNAAYKHDCEWFAKHSRPKRRSALRTQIGREFDPRPVVSNGSKPPQMLWLCIIEVCSGVHIAFPVWSGDAFFRSYTENYASVADVSSDSEIAVLLSECFRRCLRER